MFHYLRLASLTPVAKFAARVVDTGGKFATGFADTPGVVDTGDFYFSGAWGKMIHEKT
jgi:hypothetical protein